MHNWWTIYNNALARGEYPVCAEWLADEWAKRNGREGENPIVPDARPTTGTRDTFWDLPAKTARAVTVEQATLL